MAKVLGLDVHQPRRDGWHGRAGLVVKEGDLELVVSLILNLMRTSFPSRAVWLKPLRRTKWLIRKVTAAVVVVALSSAMMVVL